MVKVHGLVHQPSTVEVKDATTPHFDTMSSPWCTDRASGVKSRNAVKSPWRNSSTATAPVLGEPGGTTSESASLNVASVAPYASRLGVVLSSAPVR